MLDFQGSSHGENEEQDLHDLVKVVEYLPEGHALQLAVPVALQLTEAQLYVPVDLRQHLLARIHLMLVREFVDLVMQAVQEIVGDFLYLFELLIGLVDEVGAQYLLLQNIDRTSIDRIVFSREPTVVNEDGLNFPPPCLAPRDLL